MEILITVHPEIRGPKSRKIKRKLERVLSDLGSHESELSVLFTGDREISELNSRYRGKEGPTNVLAFPMGDGLGTDLETSMLGDVVISVDAALRESKEAGERLDDAIDRLLIHGVLHLLGYDHERSPREAERMEREEKRLLELLRAGPEA